MGTVCRGLGARGSHSRVEPCEVQNYWHFRPCALDGPEPLLELGELGGQASLGRGPHP